MTEVIVEPNPPVAPPAPEPPKFIVEYQATDEQGRPIGKPTRLTAETAEEMFEKQKQSHINAVRALQRLKDAKPTQKVAQRTFVPATMTADEEYQAGLELQNPATARQGVKKLVAAEAPLAEMQAELQEARTEREKVREQAVSLKFCQDHLQDFYPCQANAKILGDYLDEHNLQFTPDDLEIAFAANFDKLAVRPAPQVQPATVETNPLPPARQASGGLMPGQLSAQRPVRPSRLTKKDIQIMLSTAKGRAEYKLKMRDPSFVASVNAALQS